MRTSLLAAGLLAALCQAAAAGEPAQAVKIIADLNAWCASGDEALLACAVAEGRDPKVTAKPATLARIASDRAALRKLGVEIVFTFANRFETPTEIDVGLIIGGHFSPDHLGPAVHDAIIKRVAAEPVHYVTVLERVAARAASPSSLASSHIVSALFLFAKSGAKAEATALAKKLLPRYEAAQQAVPPKGDAGYPARLQQRVDGLKALITP